MTKKRVPKPIWRNSRQIQGVRNQLMGCYNVPNDGAEISIPLGTAVALIEICDQVIREGVSE